MARLTVPGTPASDAHQNAPGAQQQVVRASWDREGLSFSRCAPTPSLKNLRTRGARGVAWSPSKRIVSYDGAAPASIRRPMREEHMLPPEPETPTKGHSILLEDEWQDIEGDATGAGAGQVSADLSGISTGADTTADSTGSGVFSFSPLVAPRMRHRPRTRESPRRRKYDSSFDTTGSDTSFFASFSSKSWRLDPKMPHILAAYLQLGFNLVMLGLLVYAVWLFLSTVKSDVNLKVDEYSVDILNEIDRCAKEYLRNNCQPGKRVPALENMCNMWESCMNRDPKQVGRARVSAETFGEIVNSFLAPIGIKAMIFLVCAFSGSLILVNAVFASRLVPQRAPQPNFQTHMQTQYAAANVPATPMTPGPYNGYMLDYSRPRYHGTPKTARKRR